MFLKLLSYVFMKMAGKNRNNYLYIGIAVVVVVVLAIVFISNSNKFQPVLSGKILNISRSRADKNSRKEKICY